MSIKMTSVRFDGVNKNTLSGLSEEAYNETDKWV
jgi:hypothetical protein